MLSLAKPSILLLFVSLFAGSLLILNLGTDTNLSSRASGSCTGSGGLCQGASGCNTFTTKNECQLNNCSWTACSTFTSQVTCTSTPGCTWSQTPTPQPTLAKPACNSPNHQCVDPLLCEANGGVIRTNFSCSSSEVCCDWGPPPPTPPPAPTTGPSPTPPPSSHSCRYCTDFTASGLCQTRSAPCNPDANQCESHADCRPAVTPTPLPIGGQPVSCHKTLANPTSGRMCPDSDNVCCDLNVNDPCSFTSPKTGKLVTGTCASYGPIKSNEAGEVACQCLTNIQNTENNLTQCKGTFSFSNSGTCIPDSPEAPIQDIKVNFDIDPQSQGSCAGLVITLKVSGFWSDTDTTIGQSVLSPAGTIPLEGSFKPSQLYNLSGDFCSSAPNYTLTAYGPAGSSIEPASTALTPCNNWVSCQNPLVNKCQPLSLSTEGVRECGLTDPRCCDQSLGNTCNDSGFTCQQVGQDITGYQICACAAPGTYSTLPTPSPKSSPPTADISGPDGAPDQVVDFHDYKVMLEIYGQDVDPCARGDINCDGVVNGLDYVRMLEEWTLI